MIGLDLVLWWWTCCSTCKAKKSHHSFSLVRKSLVFLGFFWARKKTTKKQSYRPHLLCSSRELWCRYFHDGTLPYPAAAAAMPPLFLSSSRPRDSFWPYYEGHSAAAFKGWGCFQASTSSCFFSLLLALSSGSYYTLVETIRQPPKSQKFPCPWILIRTLSPDTQIEMYCNA